MRKAIMLLCTTTLFGGSIAAKDWYVSKSGSDDNSGEYATDAKLTIQAAVTAAGDGDTVLVAPGVYADFTTDSTYGRVCVLISGKQITLEASGRKADTVICGQRQTGVDHGMGTSAVRGIVASSAGGTVISGFTLVDCCTDYQSNSDGAACIGGGFYDPDGYSSTVVVEDCDFQSCSGTRGGGANGGTFIRCRFTGCIASQFGCAAQRINAFSCVFWGNRTTTVAGRQNTAGVLSYPGDTVNCTIAFNEGCPFANGDKYICNCLIVGNTAWVDVSAYFRNNASDTGVTLYDCVEVTEDDLFSPATGDWRLKSGSAAIGAGNVNYISQATIPSDCRGSDILGNARIVSGTVSCGAVEDSAAPVETGVKFVSAPPQYGLVEVNGVRTGSGVPLPFRVASLPADVTVSFAAEDGYAMVVLTNTVGATGDHWPLMDETVPLRISSATNLTYGPQTGRAYHVATDGSDTSGDGTESLPYATFSKILGLNGNKLILAHGGTYALDPVFEYGSNRVSISTGWIVRAKAVEGPSATVIPGASDASGDSGLGEGAVRCAFLQGRVALQGFTLRGGRTRELGDTSTNRRSGGGVMMVDYRSSVLDCVFEDCIGTYGSAIYGGGNSAGDGHALRCVVRGCSVPAAAATTYAVAYCADIHSCLFYSNSLPAAATLSTVIGPRCQASFCTVADTEAPFGAFSPEEKVQGWNCVVYGTYGGGVDLPYGGRSPGYRFGTGLYGSSAEPSTNYSDSIHGDPLFVDASTCDYRPLAVSPVLTAGSAGHVTDRDLADVAGVLYDFGEGMSDSCPAGCFATVVAALQAKGSNGGGISPKVARALGDSAETVTFSATSVATRPFLGFRVNGELLGYDGDSITVEVPAATNNTMTFVIEAAYGTNWYVDASQADDSGRGADWATAKKTIAAATTNAISGDVITVAPGIYDVGSDIQGLSEQVADQGSGGRTWGGSSIRARAVVHAGTMLQSSGGAAVTVIKGASATEDQQANAADVAWGGGSNAVRCAYVAQNAILKGFTLTDGRTRMGDRVDLAGHDNCMGGGVFAYDDTGIVEDCVITNCVSIRGGGASGGTYRRCRFEGNVSTLWQTVRDASLYDCFIGYNQASRSVSANHVERCTVLAQSDEPVVYSTSVDGVCRNTAIVGGFSWAGTLDHCAFAAGSGNAATSASETSCVTGDLAFDAYGRPVPGANAGINAGDNTGLAASDLDCGGGQRIYDNTIDIGAYEHDVRGDYASVLGSSRLAVSSVTPWAFSGDGGIHLYDGRLSASWRLRAHENIFFSCGVLGGGVLVVCIDGEEFARMDTACVREFKLSASDATRSLTFDYEPAGDGDAGAWLASFNAWRGAVLNFR